MMKNALNDFPNTEIKNKVTPIIFFIIILSLLLGAVAGIIKYNIADVYNYTHISNNLRGLLNNIHNITINEPVDFFESFLKNGKALFSIWLLAFLPPAAAAAVIIVFIKGMSIGFTTAVMIANFGLEGLCYALALYLPQNIVIMPAYIFITHSCLKFFIEQLRKNRDEYSRMNCNKNNLHFMFHILFSPVKFEGKTFLKYAKALIIILFCAIAASLIEKYLILSFINFI